MKKELIEKINYLVNDKEKSEVILKLISETIVFDREVTGEYMKGFKAGINQIKRQLND